MKSLSEIYDGIENPLNNTNNLRRATMECLKTFHAGQGDGFSDVKESQDEIALRQERGKLVSLGIRGQLDEEAKRRLEELNAMLNIRNPQQHTDNKAQKKGQFTGQGR